MKKKLFYSLVFILLASSYKVSANAYCEVSFRPKAFELAFAPIGSPLKVADKQCLEELVLIPHHQIIKAVTLPQGEYLLKEKNASFSDFLLVNQDDKEISSCFLCDPLKSLRIYHNDYESLCVVSKFGISTCQKKPYVDFKLSSKTTLDEGICTASLVYFGRQGSILNFGFGDCTGKATPMLKYDLKLGKTIRFLEEELEVIRADNEGIYYKYHTEPKKREGQISSAFKSSDI